MLPDFKLYHKTVITKRAWHWHKNRHIDKWERVEGPDMDPQLYGQIIFDKEEKNTQWTKDILSSINVARKIGYSHVKA